MGTRCAAVFAALRLLAGCSAPDEEAPPDDAAPSAYDASDAARTPDGAPAEDASPAPTADAAPPRDATARPDAAADAADAVDAADAAPVDAGPVSDVYPAPHPAPPTVITSGGPVLVHPRVVPVVYAGEPIPSDLATAIANVVGSAYWPSTTSEYGVGAATLGAPIVVSSPAPAMLDDADIRAWLAANVPGGGEDIYVWYPPVGTTVTGGCFACGGYHAYTVGDAGGKIVYAVVTRQANPTLDALTFTTSHEIVEAATDPHLGAYRGVDPDHAAWGVWNLLNPMPELADMCAQSYTLPSTPYLVTTSWSNASAASGHSPCVPDDGEAYFNSAVVAPDMVTVRGSVVTKGVYIPVGGTRTVEIDLFSDRPTAGPWTLAASVLGDQNALDLRLDPTSGQNGQKAQLTITVREQDPQLVGEAFVITSTLGTRTTYWYGVVGN